MKTAAEICAEIEARLFSSRKKLNSVLENCSYEFGNAYPLGETIPDECFDLITKVFSAPRFRRCGGISHWLLELQSEFLKLTDEQKATLLKVLIENHHRYTTMIAKHAAGDFIARVYEPDEVISTIRTLTKMDRPESFYVAQVATEILLFDLPPDHPFQKEIETLFLTEEELARRRAE